jgi:hypothetical protein
VGTEVSSKKVVPILKDSKMGIKKSNWCVVLKIARGFIEVGSENSIRYALNLHFKIKAIIIAI